MKLINSKKAISKILEDNSDSVEFYDFLEDDYKCPCWEIKVDRDRGDLVFLIDAKEMYAYPLNKLESSDLTIERISEYLQVFKLLGFDELKKVLSK
jgi:hypothetical protein